MNVACQAVDHSISDIETLQRVLRKNRTPQINSSDERAIIKATAYTWFNNRRSSLPVNAIQVSLDPIDDFFKDLLALSAQRTLRSKIQNRLSLLRKNLVKLRSDKALLNSSEIISDASAPDFAPLISDGRMRDILSNRWKECAFCIQSKKAPLSATVMMGGMLEALILARIHREKNQGKVFKTKAAPKESKSDKVLNLNQWTLNNYIDVAHEMGWISQTAKDVGVVLRDYRNFIHPQKEYAEGVSLSANDAILLWNICQSVANQIITCT